ncbi:hypothetical protein Y032_0025g1136 [Ancylostoma ceylanicum]|uniref:Uncharacterized protein n=1 Tax=Ancylostoma ceylanicum TaxID=53326 RepID=A0A016UVQ4_9BILA|nr:hypothetical protein Y032_0025g1136 [Ancylostoma ceylanicum]
MRIRHEWREYGKRARFERFLEHIFIALIPPFNTHFLIIISQNTIQDFTAGITAFNSSTIQTHFSDRFIKLFQSELLSSS